MDTRLQVVAIIGAVGLLLFVLELVRRRALMERYALLWLFSSLVILGLAVWDDALTRIARAMGIISARTPCSSSRSGCSSTPPSSSSSLWP